MDGSLILDIKSSVMDTIKVEGKYEDDAETELDTKYIGGTVEPKQEDEILMSIKQEEIYIKGESLTMDGDNQNNTTRITTIKKPNQKKKQCKLKEHSCDLCQYKTKLKANLTKHIRTHTGDKPFVCKICQHKTSNETNLKVHMRSHTGEKPYECNICQYKTTTKSHLMTHTRRVHTGEKPYACNTCQYKTATKFQLNMHIKKHTGEKAFTCTLCAFRTNWRYSLADHMRRSHN